MKFKENYFFSSRKKKGVYRFLIPSAKFHFEKKFKKKKIYKYLNMDYLNFKVIFFLMKIIFSPKLIKRKDIYKIKYNGYFIGRYVVPEIYRDYQSYNINLIYYYQLVKGLYFAALTVDTSMKLKNIKGAFIDHCMYRNGLLMKILSKKKIPIYTLGYPRGFYLINNTRGRLLQYENIVQLNKAKKIDNTRIQKAKKYIKIVLSQTEKFPWMRNIKFVDKLNLNLSNLTHVIYVHSFTDAQMLYGYDGFTNVFEWLDFTVSYLLKNKNNKILIKAHPCFFHQKFPNKNAIYDRKIFFKFYKKFYKEKNLIILKEPIRNKFLLKIIPKKTILISHHGSVILESSHLGFKSIVSNSTFWSPEFKISNNWSSIEHYKIQLNKKWSELFYSNKCDLYNVSYQLFCNPQGIYGKNYWESIFVNQLKITKSNLFEDPIKTIQNISINKKEQKKLISKIYNSIEDILIDKIKFK